MVTDTNSGRRRLLKALSLGGAVTVSDSVVPRSWVSPVVDSVLLPAHAQTSIPIQRQEIPAYHGRTAMSTGNELARRTKPATLIQDVLNGLIPAAHALELHGVEVVIQADCLQPAGSPGQTINIQVAFLIRHDTSLSVEQWGAMAVPADGSTVSLARLTPGHCLGTAASISITEDGELATGAIGFDIDISSWSAGYAIPLGSMPLPTEQCGVAT
jgi:hypothetical protein